MKVQIWRTTELGEELSKDQNQRKIYSTEEYQTCLRLNIELVRL